jgi:hypothetical protein
VALYFDNPAALAAKEAKIRGEYASYSWMEAVAEIVDKLDAHPRRPSSPSPIAPYARLAFGDATEDLSARTMLGTGWGRADSTGRPMVDAEAELRFTYTGVGAAFWIRVGMRNPVGKAGADRQLAVQIDGGDIKSVSVAGHLGAFDLHVQRAEHTGPLTTLRVVESTAETRLPRLAIVSLSVADTVADLDELDRAAKRATAAMPAAAAARTAVPSAAPTPAAHSGSRPVAHSFGRPSTADLVRVLASLKAPSRLSDRFFVFKVLKLLGLERFTLRVYRKLMRRPHDALSVVVKYLLAEANAKK